MSQSFSLPKLLNSTANRLSTLNDKWRYSELILCNRLSINKQLLYSTDNIKISQNQLSLIEEDVKKALKGAPLSYILGEKEFYNLSFYINDHVLIPRPETEQIVEIVIDYINCTNQRNLQLLDVGTGSGCLPISISVNADPSKIQEWDALDISKEALKVAKHNNKHLNRTQNLVKFKQLDILTTTIKKQYDVITSNPPYISLEDYNELDGNVYYFEPRIALTDGKDGNTFYPPLLNLCKTNLQEGGIAIFECSVSATNDIRRKAAEILPPNKYSIDLIKDYTDRYRFILIRNQTH